MAGKGDEVDLTADVEKAWRDAAFPAQTGNRRENTSLSAPISWFTCLVCLICAEIVLRFFRDAVSNQEMESQLDFQKSTGAFISDKDRELEILRNEVHLRERHSISVGLF